MNPLNWLQIAALVYQLFGPAIAAWLKSLLAREGIEFGLMPFTTPAAVTEWFAGVRSRLRWWEFGKHARLNLLERIATKHAPTMAAALRNGRAAPVLDADDEKELALAL